jgi:hypothetical protein
MFSRAAVQELLDQRATLGHVANVLAPYSFDMRPVGFSLSEPNYRVFVERAAFRMRAAVVPDYLAVAIVSAVVAGARNNPRRVAKLEADLTKAGWTPHIVLSPEGFTIEATMPATSTRDDSELAETGVTVGLMMSEFVLDQLVITRPVGEMRAAVERALGEAGTDEVWLYDPSERDRSTQVHRSLENWLIVSLRELGLEPLDPAGEPFFDLAWRVGRITFVCEVKSSANSEEHQLRLGFGQVLQYQQALETLRSGPIVPVLLVEREPADRGWLDLCARHGVVLFWPGKWPDVVARLTSARDG